VFQLSLHLRLVNVSGDLPLLDRDVDLLEDLESGVVLEGDV